MKKKITLVVVLLISYMLIFILGSWVGRTNTIRSLDNAYQNASFHVVLGHYSSYRDIALKIKTGQYKDAECHAEMSATSMFDGLRSCLANQNCKMNIGKKAREFAPEVLGEAVIPIKQRTQCSTP